MRPPVRPVGVADGTIGHTDQPNPNPAAGGAGIFRYAGPPESVSETAQYLITHFAWRETLDVQYKLPSDILYTIVYKISVAC